jgi:hypothetical protein
MHFRSDAPGVETELSGTRPTQRFKQIIKFRIVHNLILFQGHWVLEKADGAEFAGIDFIQFHGLS